MPARGRTPARVKASPRPRRVSNARSSSPARTCMKEAGAAAPLGARFSLSAFAAPEQHGDVAPPVLEALGEAAVRGLVEQHALEQQPAILGISEGFLPGADLAEMQPDAIAVGIVVVEGPVRRR